MKKVAAFAVLVLFGISTMAFAETLMTNHKDAKIRNGPDTKYTVLWQPRLYTPLELLAKFNKWYAVRDFEGDVGWIHESTVLKKPAAIVRGDVLNVRKEPNMKARILYKAPKNYTFKVLQQKKGWLRVEDPDGDKGWVSKKGVWTGPKK
ncbi:MAG: SH3 domain-containing protein [Nitrospinota bacterium]